MDWPLCQTSLLELSRHVEYFVAEQLGPALVGRLLHLVASRPWATGAAAGEVAPGTELPAAPAAEAAQKQQELRDAALKAREAGVLGAEASFSSASPLEIYLKYMQNPWEILWTPTNASLFERFRHRAPGGKAWSSLRTPP